MGQHKQFQILFVGQSRSVATNLQALVQLHAQKIFVNKNNPTLPEVEFTEASSQRQALQIVRGAALDIVMLETGAGNGNRLKFAEAIHKQQPVARILEVGREQAESPHPFSGFLKLPLQSKQAVEVLQHAVRPVTSHLLPFGPFMLDSANDILFCPNGEKQLRPMETRLLSYLVVNRSVIVKRVELMRHVWGTEYFDDTRTLDVHIRQLRKHLEEDPSAPQYLITERGRGYLLKV